MTLEKLVIEKPWRATKAGSYCGKAKFAGKHGTVEIPLDESQIRQIFALCADSLLDSTKEVTQLLTSDIIEHKAQLELENDK